MRLNKLILFLSLFSAFTVCAEDQTPTWMKFPLTPDSVLKTDIYTNSIADSIFIEFWHKGFLPPIPHVSRALEKDFGKQVAALEGEIAHNLDIDHPKQPTQLRSGPFKGGVHRDLDGRFVELQSTDDDGINFMTCMAFVKDGNKIHALYAKVLSTSLPKCSDELIRLARDPVVYR